MNKTGIEWCDYSWGITTGCMKKCSYCYNLTKPGMPLTTWVKSHRQNETGEFHIAKPGEVYPYGFDPTYYPHRWGQPASKKKPSRIFVADCGDLFDPLVPDWVIRQVMVQVRAADWHTFLFLTKRDERLASFNPWPKNAWVGATATDYDSFVEACGELEGLYHRHGTMTFISLEPLLAWDSTPGFTLPWLNGKVGWLIIGAMTGPGAREHQPKRKWILELEEAADKAGIPVFEKQNIGPMGRPWRQEFPHD